MVLADLKERLKQERIKHSCYYFGCNPPIEYQDGVYLMETDGSLFYIYYMERGQKLDKHILKTEEEACQYMYDTLIRYVGKNSENTPSSLPQEMLESYNKWMQQH